jgi:hypothetical protein
MVGTARTQSSLRRLVNLSALRAFAHPTILHEQSAGSPVHSGAFRKRWLSASSRLLPNPAKPNSSKLTAMIVT